MILYARKPIMAYNLRSKVENWLKEMWFGIQLSPVIIPSISDRQYSLQNVKAKQYVASTLIKRQWVNKMSTCLPPASVNIQYNLMPLS